MEKISEQIAQMLFEFWKFDMMVYSEVWLYIPLLIPSILYTMFFMAKWSIITAPIWLPFSIILRSLKNNQND